MIRQPFLCNQWFTDFQVDSGTIWRSIVARAYGRYLVRRNGIYHVRIIVPPALRPILGVAVLKRSLHTTDRRTGMLLALQQASIIQEELAALSQNNKPAPVMKSIALDLVNRELKLQSPYTPEEVTDAIRIAKELGWNNEPPRPTVTPTLSKAFSDCINPYLSERSLTPKSRGEAESILRQYDSWCKSKQLDPWQRSSAVSYREELKKRVHPKTLNKHADRLNGLGTWAARLEYIPKNPLDGLRVPLLKRKASEERPALSYGEVASLVGSVNLSDPRHWWI